MTDIDALLHFIQFIPLEDEILDFFRPVAADIMKQLRAKACLPTQGTDSDDDDDDDGGGGCGGGGGHYSWLFSSILLHAKMQVL